jgi:protein-S-isoprenylcysteine O-methyltransferase Ste14
MQDSGSDRWLPARAIAAFLALPGVVGFLAPWLIAGGTLSARAFDWLAVVPLAAGFILLISCVMTFYRAGRGTLAPWDPPRVLVEAGAYRWSRNPMYVSVTLILWGWALGLHSSALAIYAIVVMAAFHVRVMFGEEPWLSRRWGPQWNAYSARVPRWFGPHRRS